MERQDTGLWKKKLGVGRQDPAMHWKHHVSLQWYVRDVREVRKALPKDVQRQSVESRVDSQS